MNNERLRADAAMLMEVLKEQVSGISAVQRSRNQLTATVTACEKRISVTVNGDGILIETKFSEDIGDLGYVEIAAAMTEAVQAASRKVQKMSQELLKPLREQKDGLPRLSDIVEGAPDFSGIIPVPSPASLAPPDSPERAQEDQDVVIGDLEELPPSRSIISDNDR